MNECQQDVEMVKEVAKLNCLEGPVSNLFGSMIFYPNQVSLLNKTNAAVYREHDCFALFKA